MNRPVVQRPGWAAAWAAAMVVACAGSPALAQTSASAEDGEEQADSDESQQSALAAGVVLSSDKSPFLLNSSLATLVGQGTFVGGPQGNANVVSQLSVSPSYRLGGVVLFASQTVAWEWTDPDNATGRQLEPFDTSLGVLWPLSLEAIDTRVQLVGGVRLPISYASRAEGQYGGLFIGGTGIYQTPLKGLQLVLGLRGQVNGSAESLRSDGGDDTTFEDRTLGEVAIASCYARAGEDQATACGAIPTTAQLSGRLSLIYVVGKLTFSTGLSVISQFRGDLGPDDELQSDNARAGLNARTFTSGTVSTSYAAQPWWLITAGITSFQPIQTADGQSVRFPFWNFSGANNNFSSLFLSMTFLY